MTAQALGIDPVHFGVMAVVNIMLGLVTPSYGLLLFMMSKIAEVPLRDIPATRRNMWIQRSGNACRLASAAQSRSHGEAGK